VRGAAALRGADCEAPPPREGIAWAQKALRSLWHHRYRVVRCGCRVHVV